MKMGFELNLSQTQKLIMTPELRQAIQILQFNNVELSEFINKQLEVNPFLETADKNNDSNSSEEITNDFEKNETKEEIDWKDVLEKYDDISYKAYGNVIESEYKQTFESYTSKKMTLKDHLMVQIGVSVKTQKEKRIGEFIIESLDSKGYLGCSLQDISLLLNEDIVEIERILRLIQTFDPVGVGARSLSECLKIQMKEKGIKDKNAYIIVEDYLEDVATNKIQKIAKELHITINRVQNICDIIKILEPKPSRGFIVDSDNIRYIVPDVTIEKIGDEYIIIVNDNNLPMLTISSYYKDMINNLDNKEANKFLTDKLNSSMWLIKSIEQRKMTLYKVVESILKFQRKFFDEGKTELKPLVLKDVADEIGIHESTVSRATNGKYVQTPRGLFELKYFFSSSLNDESGGSVSSTSVKTKIKNLIEKENSKKPLSDQKISDILNEDGVNISRRTVAKYRDEMRIPSSSLRRRY
ncbi:RNA polymerase factor sigma-54 [Sedimentibacter sp. MB31-C6]|uniref:RNA polymerase factor sigma-54 n=1 Tax=Sedimentibacter sp. MB31-C6 TaxID=3109366 RepID=UPI002DDD6D3F|nr:RNA polymerase factor sigma-54 [Sedimentibacter sp. MB36-C1]WSI04079.1 RNA polymerase factor sigma-54 [Sedimentibacter sp. MB36-C1]